MAWRVLRQRAMASAAMLHILSHFRIAQKPTYGVLVHCIPCGFHLSVQCRILKNIFELKYTLLLDIFEQ